MYVRSAGAFKTLDKDNTGTIDLDIKEVIHFTVLSFSQSSEFSHWLKTQNETIQTNKKTRYAVWVSVR